jgi:hypothetical protein
MTKRKPTTHPRAGVPYDIQAQERERAQREIEVAMWALPLSRFSEEWLSLGKLKKGQDAAARRARRVKQAVEFYIGSASSPWPARASPKQSSKIHPRTKRPKNNEVRGGFVVLLAERCVSLEYDRMPTPPAPTEKMVDDGIKKGREKLVEALLFLGSLDSMTLNAWDRAIEDAPHPPEKTSVVWRELMKYERPQRSIRKLMVDIETAIGAVELAKIPAAAKDKQGPDEKVDALEIAKMAATDFYSLAGTEPTSSWGEGNFLHFLAAIFGALGRHDSAENLGRKACRWWRELRPRKEFLENMRATEPPDASEGIRVIETRPPPRGRYGGIGR